MEQWLDHSSCSICICWTNYHSWTLLWSLLSTSQIVTCEPHENVGMNLPLLFTVVCYISICVIFLNIWVATTKVPKQWFQKRWKDCTTLTQLTGTQIWVAHTLPYLSHNYSWNTVFFPWDTCQANISPSTRFRSMEVFKTKMARLWLRLNL